MDVVLSVRGAEKRYGATEALRGVDLALGRGRWLGLLGPNGAGKTSLVRAIAGRVALDAGQLELLGAPITRASAAARAARRRLGIVPQDLALYQRLSAAENLAVFGRYQGLAGAALAERVSWALAWIGLDSRRDALVSSFSGGMKRRLNIAASVLHRPEVVLLDEPTVGVDPQSRQRIWEMLDELRQAGTSLLLTTHQLAEAQTVCQEIVIIDHGRVIAQGSFEELVSRTLGRGRRVALTLARAPSQALLADLSEIVRMSEGGDGDDPHDGDGRDSDETRPGSVSMTAGADHTVHCQIGALAKTLPALLTALAQAEYPVIDIDMSAPSLDDVFLHLTGRELRE